MPNTTAITPARIPPASGHAKFLFSPSREVFRHARSGPTPVRKSRKSAMGTFTLLKNGGPTLIFVPCTHSEKTGNNVPQSTAKHAARRIRLLNRKLDSRETSESS